MSTIYSALIGDSIVKFLITAPPDRPLIGRQLRNVTDVSFSVSMFGGYDTASVKIGIGPGDLMSMRDYLGKDIRIFDRFGAQIWEGFVNVATATAMAVETKHGPLIEVANSIDLKYTEYLWNTITPEGGDEARTGFRQIGTPNVVQSSAEWGVLREIITSPRPLNQAEAEDVCDNLTNLKARPKELVSIMREDREWSGELECLGYFHLMKKCIADYYVTEDWAVELVMAWPFQATAPGLFDTGGIEHVSGGPMLHLWNEEPESAFDFLESSYTILNTYGDYGWMFGVYDNRLVVLQENIRPSFPDIYVSARTGIPITSGGADASVYARPGMWVKPVHFPSPVPTVGQEMFLIESVEMSGGIINLNYATFSAIDRILGDRGV